jgi:hypothetical protein
MLILILELSQIPDHPCNLCKDLSLNTQKIKLPSPQSNPKSILHRRRFFRLTYLSDLAFPCLYLGSSFRLSHTIRSEMIASTLLSFKLLPWFCSRTKFSSVFKNSICFLISVEISPCAVLPWP